MFVITFASQQGDSARTFKVRRATVLAGAGARVVEDRGEGTVVIRTPTERVRESQLSLPGIPDNARWDFAPLRDPVNSSESAYAARCWNKTRPL